MNGKIIVNALNNAMLTDKPSPTEQMTRINCNFAEI